jgi:hypothetical protein
MKPVVVETGIPSEINEEIVRIIRMEPGWTICNDHFTRPGLGDYSDTGLLLTSYTDDRATQHFDSPLNTFAKLILSVIIKKAVEIELVNPQIVRFFWNYYNKSSTGVFHRDVREDREGNFLSVVYYLNNNDGGTEIENEVVYCKESRAAIFNSRSRHRGFGPYDFNYKMCLNAVLMCDAVNLKGNI